jgi:6-phosphogluconolactonase (cycloisomerase 2 family)
MYSIQEEGSTIVLFDYAGEQGRLTARQTISSLPPGYAGSNFCSEFMRSNTQPLVLQAFQHNQPPPAPQLQQISQQPRTV